MKNMEVLDGHKSTVLSGHSRIAVHELTVDVTDCIYMTCHLQVREETNIKFHPSSWSYWYLVAPGKERVSFI